MMYSSNVASALTLISGADGGIFGIAVGLNVLVGVSVAVFVAVKVAVWVGVKVIVLVVVGVKVGVFVRVGVKVGVLVFVGVGVPKINSWPAFVDKPNRIAATIPSASTVFRIRRV